MLQQPGKKKKNVWKKKEEFLRFRQIAKISRLYVNLHSKNQTHKNSPPTKNPLQKKNNILSGYLFWVGDYEVYVCIY